MKKIVVNGVRFSCLTMLVVVLNACAIQKQQPSVRSPKVSILAGTNRGGISDVNDLKQMVDGSDFKNAHIKNRSGMLFTGYHAGLHISQSLRWNQLEAGVDFMHNKQSFEFTDVNNLYLGVRRLDVNQLMLPISYNIGLFRKSLPLSEIQLKLGYMWQLNLIDSKGSGALSDYFVSSVSKGVVCGVSATLFHFGNGRKLGLYCDVYQGSHIFTDYFSQSSFLDSGSGFVKTGFRFQL